MTPLQVALNNLVQGHHLTTEEAAAAFGVVMRGEATADQIRELLVGLKSKGETADEIAGAAEALRAAMIRLPVTPHFAPRTSHSRPLVDTCGTGGGTVTTFNISTTAAFVAAGAGVPIAKHGNRSFTSRSGSADVLEALGVDIALSPERAAEVLADVGLAFLFAPNYHPAMRHVAPVRKELKTATIMNLLGPLANPAGVTRQVLGVSDAARGPLVAEALGRLGAVHALVVHAEVGMDEISPAGVTHVWELGSSRAGHRSQVTGHSAPGITEWDLRPETFDLRHDDLGALKGGEPAENAERLERLLSDASTDPAGRAAVLLNAAAAIYVSGPAMEFGEAVESAKEAMEQGRALRVLEALKNSARRA
ncbi:MAG: anthranilate phosphoribosyltransferase [Gemmatimonadota bacterium]